MIYYDAKGVYVGPYNEKQTIREAVPCGHCVTTRYLDVDGTLLRQDILIEASTPLVAGMPVPSL